MALSEEKTGEAECLNCTLLFPLKDLHCANYDELVSKCTCGHCEPYCESCFFEEDEEEEGEEEEDGNN